MGNTLGATGLTGSNLYFAGINNITLSQATDANGGTISISGGNTTQFAGSGTTFGGTNISASMTLNSLGLALSASVGSQAPAGVVQLNGSTGTLSLVAGSSLSASSNASTITFGLASNISTYLQTTGNYLTTAAQSSVSNQTGISSIIVSNTTYTSGAVSFSNANGITFGSSAGQAITASYNSTQFAGSGFTSGGANVGISGTHNSAGLSLSVTAAAQSNQTLGVYASSQTYGQSSSSNVNATALSVVGSGIISVGLSAGSLLISAAAGAAQTAVSGIIVSNTTYTSGTVSFSNANGISFGSSAGQAITASYTVPATAGLVSAIAVSGGAGTSNTVTGMTFLNSNGLTFGVSTGASAASITASYTQSAQAVSAQGGSSTFSTLVFTNSNNLTFTNTGGSVAGSWALNVSGGAGTSNALSGLTFANSNGLTFGLSTGAGVGTLTGSYNSTQFAGTGTTFAGNNVSGSMTLNSAGLNLSLSAGAGGGGGVAIAASNSTFTSGTVVLSAAGGAITISNGAQSALFSVPQTSSLVGASGISVSVNASTISVYLNAASRFIWPYHQVTAVGALGNGSMSIQYMQLDEALVASRLDVPFAWSAGSAATTATMAIVMTVNAGVYTRANSTALSSVATGSTQTTYSYASNSAGNTQLLANAIRPVSCPINVSLMPGEYWVGFNLSTNSSSIGLSTTNLGQTISVYGGANIQTALQWAEFTNVTNSTTNMYGGMGIYSAATAATLTSIGLANIVQTGASLSQANIGLVFRNY
jgi:hypothetical protein